MEKFLRKFKDPDKEKIVSDELVRAAFLEDTHFSEARTFIEWQNILAEDRY